MIVYIKKLLLSRSIREKGVYIIKIPSFSKFFLVRFKLFIYILITSIL